MCEFISMKLQDFALDTLKVEYTMRSVFEAQLTSSATVIFSLATGGQSSYNKVTHVECNMVILSNVELPVPTATTLVVNLHPCRFCTL